jgi:hypothetical protein
MKTILTKFRDFGVTEETVNKAVNKMLDASGETNPNNRLQLRKKYLKKVLHKLEDQLGNKSQSVEVSEPFEKRYSYSQKNSNYSFGFNKKSCYHGTVDAKPIKIAGTEGLYCFGTRFGSAADPEPDVDYLVSLNGDTLPSTYGKWFTILNLEMQDYGGVTNLVEVYIPVLAGLLKEGKKVGIYCTGSHGRTGTVLAMLIGHMEPNCDDPIEVARERHCNHAVESLAQAKGIFKFLGKELPEKYEKEFYRPPASQIVMSRQVASSETSNVIEAPLWTGHLG